MGSTQSKFQGTPKSKKTHVMFKGLGQFLCIGQNNELEDGMMVRENTVHDEGNAAEIDNKGVGTELAHMKDTFPEPNCPVCVLGWKSTHERLKANTVGIDWLEAHTEGITDQNNRWNNKLRGSFVKRQKSQLESSKRIYKRWPCTGKELTPMENKVPKPDCKDGNKRWNKKLQASLPKIQTSELDSSKRIHQRWPRPGKETRYWRQMGQYSERFSVDECHYMPMDFSQRKRRWISNSYILM